MLRHRASVVTLISQCLRSACRDGVDTVHYIFISVNDVEFVIMFSSTCCVNIDVVQFPVGQG